MASRALLGILLTAAAATLAACSGSDASEKSLEQSAQEACEQGVRDKFKDPASAQFQNVVVEFKGDSTPATIVKDGVTRENVPGRYWSVSGEVNAKNGFGAYVGFSTFKCEAQLRDGDEMSPGFVKVYS